MLFKDEDGEEIYDAYGQEHGVYNLVSMYDLALGDMRNIDDKGILFNLALQAILSHEIAYQLIGFIHNDFKPDNILFIK